MQTLATILNTKLVAILRDIDPANLLEIVDALNAAGIVAIEITLNSEDALNMIAKVRKNLPGVIIGAGTVMTEQDVCDSAAAGAKFIVSPIVSKQVIERTKAMGLVSIPGAFTPTEIFKAQEFGADLVKVFPASVGAPYFKDLTGPLANVKLMATGGITLENIGSFINAGVSAFGIGGGLIEKTAKVNNHYIETLYQRSKCFLRVVQNISADPKGQNQ